MCSICEYIYSSWSIWYDTHSVNYYTGIYVRRSVLQGGHYWSFNLAPMRFFPSPAGWGWQLIEGEWHPYWTDLETAKDSCPDLTKCRCRKKCLDCNCTKSNATCDVHVNVIVRTIEFSLISIELSLISSHLSQ